jgi:hypothetical protein
MARKLHYRVVECKVRQGVGTLLVEAWLLIQGKGKSVRFTSPDRESLPEALASACAAAYQDVTGSPLPDSAH